MEIVACPGTCKWTGSNGVDANRLGLSLRAAALNLRRLINLGLDHNGTTWTITS